MQKKKKLILLVSIIIIFILLIYLNINSNTNIQKFNQKIDLLQQLCRSNPEIKEIEKNDLEKIVIVSICDKNRQATIKTAKGNSINNAYENVKKQVNKYIEENNYEAHYVKVDIIKNIEEISKGELKYRLNKLEQEYTFRKGIILNVNSKEVILTEAELNSNKIIDYSNSNISIKMLNEYLKKYNQEEINEIPEKIKVFTTISYFCDENKNAYVLYNNNENTGRRNIVDLEKQDVDDIVKSGNNYLTDMLKDNGEFIYGYNPLTDTENSNYNILRHAGSVWSLIVTYDKEEDVDGKKKQKIEKALEYLNNTIIQKDDDISYVVEVKNNEIKLGGNALTVIAMCEYTNKFENTNYINTIKKLGNGILSMQNADGSYIHVLDKLDFNLKEKYRTVYYDGEATFALGKLYGIVKEDKYLQGAKNAMDYFIEKDYTQYIDHWISYATNEITKYVDNEEYYKFGLRNVGNNLDTIYSKSVTSHINFEMLLQCFEMYNRMLEKQINIDYLRIFPKEDFIRVINYRAKYQLNSYLWPEIAMYLKTPRKYINTFFIRTSDFRIRIDDIQHSILGYYWYSENFNKIENMK